jgi:hypothetical protein
VVQNNAANFRNFRKRYGNQDGGDVPAQRRAAGAVRSSTIGRFL